MNLRDIAGRVLDSTSKGIPAPGTVTPGSVAGKGWSLLEEDLHFPVMVLVDPALEHNLGTMARWCRENGFLHAPHGKTTMCPQIFKRQIDAGAWGITVATASQAMVCARFGVERILIANQLVGRANIRSVASAMERDPKLEVFCLADSVEGVQHLARHLKESGAPRPLRVFLEGGRTGWRTGVRSIEEARGVLAEVRRHAGLLEFAGFEGFEGIAKPEEGGAVEEFLRGLAGLADELSRDAGPGPLYFSAGGTSFIDYVRDAFKPLAGRYRTILRSGCYATHDHGGYARHLERARGRGKGEEAYPEFKTALELWSLVQSVRDGTTAILTFGRRDCPHDSDYPVPLYALRPGQDRREARPLAGAKVFKLYDQHAHMSIPPGAELRVGDRVACGICHPCTAFDKWAVIPLVDEARKVIDLYCTYF